MQQINENFENRIYLCFKLYSESQFSREKTLFFLLEFFDEKKLFKLEIFKRNYATNK